jgi:hypothetical protein
LEDKAIEVAVMVPASRKLGEDTARELIQDSAKITIAKGKKIDIFDGGQPTDEIVSRMLGSTGNLRAPTNTVGDRLVVGYNEDVYQEIFGE